MVVARLCSLVLKTGTPIKDEFIWTISSRSRLGAPNNSHCALGEHCESVCWKASVLHTRLPFSRRWTICAGVSGMMELRQYQQWGLCSYVSPRCATAPLSSRPLRPLYLSVCWSCLGRMAREVGGHLALCALQLAQINASLLILGALKVSSAMVLKMAKQQQESVPH